jgi:hypothetical protein
MLLLDPELGEQFVGDVFSIGFALSGTEDYFEFEKISESIDLVEVYASLSDEVEGARLLD